MGSTFAIDPIFNKIRLLGFRRLHVFLYQMLGGKITAKQYRATNKIAKYRIFVKRNGVTVCLYKSCSGQSIKTLKEKSKIRNDEEGSGSSQSAWQYGNWFSLFYQQSDNGCAQQRNVVNKLSRVKTWGVGEFLEIEVCKELASQRNKEWEVLAVFHDDTAK